MAAVTPLLRLRLRTLRLSLLLLMLLPPMLLVVLVRGVLLMPVRTPPSWLGRALLAGALLLLRMWLLAVASV